MGLLDIWQDWKNENQVKSSGFEDYLPTQGGTLDTAGGVNTGAGINATINRKSESPLIKKPIFNTKMFPPGQGQAIIGGKTINLPQSVLTPEAQQKQLDAINSGNQLPPSLRNQVEGQNKLGINEEQSKKFFGMTLDEIKSNYKDKGGFDGLMANPAFTLGLAIMQSSAQGKRIDENILDNFVKAAGISETFKKKLADRTSVIEVTEGQMNKIKNVLSTLNISAPSLRRTLPGNQPEMYEQAVEDIAMKVQQKVNAKISEAKKSGKKIEVGNRLYKEIINEMINSGEIDRKGGLKIGNIQLIDYTLEAKPIAGNREHGGPVQEGKPYVVGEAGPEVVIPTSDGNVLSNDDSQIFAMLLASNPQLQKVSKQRAERILRARFPEYFE